MLYNVRIYYLGGLICTMVERAETEEDAGLQAELRFMRMYPKMEYDNVVIKVSGK